MSLPKSPIDSEFKLEELKNENKEIRISYLNIRRALGILGILLPFLLYSLNEFKWEKSISYYYYASANSRNIFVGILCAFGIFLLSYYGYKRKGGEYTSDNWVTNFGGSFILIVAFLPTDAGAIATISGYVHLLAAFLFFMLMGYMSFQHFTRGGSDTNTKKKKKVFYRICGVMIWLCMVFLLFKFASSSIEGNMILWAEIVALIFFALSWLVKGLPSD